VYQNGRRIILSKNDVFLLNCYQPHCYGIQSGSELEILWVHFDGTVVHNYFNQIAKNTNCTVLKSLSPDRFRIIYDNLYTIHNNFEKQQDINDILNNKYLVAVMTEFLLESFAVSGKNSRSWDSLIIYISENVKKSLKLADLAERMALSPYHFIRQFKKRTGYTPHQYILMTRINTAIYLLQHTDLSVKEIAFSCGFSRVGAFCNAFKRMMDVWPMTYRTAAGE
jgi:AraC-like DNA-binding protein